MSGAARRGLRDRKPIRANLNENQLTLDASQGEIDADESAQYRVPKSRKSRGGEADEADEDAEAGDEDEGADETTTARKPRARKSAAGGAGGVAASVVSSKKGHTAADLKAIDAAELPSPIYQAIANTKSTPTAIAHEVLTQYNNPKKSQRAVLGLISCILQSCGCTHLLRSEDLDVDASQTVAQASDIKSQSTIEPPLTRVKNFATRWIEFWQKLTIESDNLGILYDSVLYPEVILRWLQSCAASPIRIWRQTATLAAFAIIEQINTIALTLEERVIVLERQSKDKQLKKAKAAELRQDLETANMQIDTVKDLLKTGFDTIFVHRFRDVSPDIRLLCIQQLGVWLRSYPSHWLVDGHIKYVGWTLNDKSSEVRLASLDAIVELLATEDEAIRARTDAFCTRFKPRFLQLTNDVDPQVAAKAVEYLTLTLKFGNMTEEDGDYSNLLWDANPEIRERAAGFVYEDTFKEDETKEAHQEEITQLLNIMDSSCPLIENKEKDSSVRSHRVKDDKFLSGFSRTLQQPMDTLVNTFWSRLAALRDYDALTKLMIALSKPMTSEKGLGSKKTSAPVDEDRQLLLCHLLASVAKRATGHMADAPNLSSTKKKADREALLLEAQRFSAHFVTVGAQLLTLYQQDPTKLRVLLPILSQVDLTLYGELRKAADFTAILKRLKSIYTKHSDDGVLEEAANALRCFVDTEHQFKDQSFDVATELATELASEWHVAYERVHGSQVDIEMDADERLEAMSVALKRMTCLQRSLRLAQLQWDSMADLEKSLNYYALNHSEPKEQELLVLLMQFGFTTLAWNYHKLHDELMGASDEADGGSASEADDADEMDVEEEQKSPAASSKKKKKSTRGKRASTSASSSAKQSSIRDKKESAKLLVSTHRLEVAYLSQLEIAMQSNDVEAFAVKNAAYRVLSDCFILFTGKLAGTPLESLVIPADKLRSLQAEYNQYFITLIDATDVKHRIKGANEKLRATFIADQRIFAFKDAIKVALYDMNSLPSKDQMRTPIRHRELAGMLLARFGSLGDEVDSLLKSYMLSLKTISTNTLLQAQFHGLEYCWSAQVPDSELKTLATKFVNLHGINPNTRSFTGLFRHGLIYALANPPTNLKFLDVIIPFVQRASIADLKHLARIFQQFGTRCLDSVEPEDRVEEEWESIHTFTEVINKKFQAEVLIVEPRSVTIEVKAAKSIPASPAPATPARGKKGRKGDESETITGVLTPMSSPGPTPKSAGGRRSRAPKRPHETVEEEDEEEEKEEHESNGISKDEDAADEEDEAEGDDSMETDEPPKRGRGKKQQQQAAAPRRGRKRAADK